MLKVNKLYNLDCREGLEELEDESIDCCISSPPYWNLRDYSIGKDAIGLEPNFELYIKHLCDIYDQVKRVLKKSGTCWVNLGDIYAGSGVQTKWDYKEGAKTPSKKYKQNYTSKCLLMIPQRFAIEMIKRGWILRNVIIWHKPNCMPSSVRDRFTVDFEYVYFFVKSKKYWFEQQRVPHKRNFSNEGGGWRRGVFETKENTAWKNDPLMKRGFNQKFYYNPLGRNMRTVWTIPTKANPEAHFATFPPKLIEPMIKAGCPKEGIVLDPFAGIGTTLKEVWRLGGNYIGFEISKEYCEISKKGLSNTQNKRMDEFIKSTI